MGTRSSARNLFPPLDNPELTIRRRSHADPTLLNDFEMVAEGNGDPPVPDLRTIEELCQPSLNGRGGPVAPIAIQATNFELKNDMIQQRASERTELYVVLKLEVDTHKVHWVMGLFNLLLVVFVGYLDKAQQGPISSKVVRSMKGLMHEKTVLKTSLTQKHLRVRRRNSLLKWQKSSFLMK
nr:valine--tRNA ligase, mitochondrial 1-like [Tanacetum cinerariifolium]